MQKLDLRNNLHSLIVGLKSKEIVQLLDGQQLQGSQLMTHIVNSKAAFDRLSTDDQMTKVFDQFQLQTIYSTQFFSHIIRVVSNLGAPVRSRTDFLNDSHITTFYSHHKTLLATFNIVENLLLDGIDFFDDQRNFNIAQAQENGNLILQIIDENNIYSKYEEGMLLESGKYRILLSPRRAITASGAYRCFISLNNKLK